MMPETYWYIVVDRLRPDDGRLTQRPTRYRKNVTRYRVFGPYNVASARFHHYGNHRLKAEVLNGATR